MGLVVSKRKYDNLKYVIKRRNKLLFCERERINELEEKLEREQEHNETLREFNIMLKCEMDLYCNLTGVNGEVIRPTDEINEYNIDIGITG